MLRKMLMAGAVIAGATGGVMATSALRPYDPQPWLTDFAALRDSIAAGYANLHWKVSTGEVNPYTLTAATDSAIRHAGSDRAARKALQSFVAAFQDGHLALRKPRPLLEAIERRVEGGFSGEPVTAALDAAAACSELGLGYHDDPPLLAAAEGYEPLPSDSSAFMAGTFSAADGSTLGIVRIALFSPEAYRPACERAWPRFRATLPADEPCTGSCEDRLHAALDAQLTAELAVRVRQLEAAGARAIVVDLTGNGGGRNWVDAAARVMTNRTLRSPRSSFVRHPHWVPVLEADLAAVERDLERDDLDSVRHGLLSDARERLALALEEARTPCDVSALWTHPSPALECTNVGSAELYTTGAYGWLAPGAAAGLGSSEALFGPGASGPARGVGSVPLVVLVDRSTASASEYFAAMLRDNDAAVVVGEKTYGAGCGFTNGGIPVVLPNSGLHLSMPDCLRLRADGSNEVAGIVPDVPVGWTDEDDDAARAEKALAAMSRIDLVTGGVR